MLDMREADRITTQSNTESKFSTSSQGSGVFWKPMVYLTSSSEAGSSTGSQHNMLHPRRGQRLAAERSQGSEADSFDIDERRFFKPSRQNVPHFIFGDSSASGSSQGAPRIQSHAARIRKRDQKHQWQENPPGGYHQEQASDSAGRVVPAQPYVQAIPGGAQVLVQQQLPQLQQQQPMQPMQQVQQVPVQAAQILVPQPLSQPVQLQVMQPVSSQMHFDQLQLKQTLNQPLQEQHMARLPAEQPQLEQQQPAQIQQSLQQLQLLLLLIQQQQKQLQQQQQEQSPQQEQLLQQIQLQQQQMLLLMQQQQQQQAPERQVVQTAQMELQHSEPVPTHPSPERPEPLERRPLDQWSPDGLSSENGDEADEEADQRPKVKAPGKANSLIPSGTASKGSAKQVSKPSAQNLRLAQPLPVGPQDPAETKGSTMEELLAKVPNNEEGERTSLGSLQHPDTCSPCLFWFKGKCGKGVQCDYCHFRHPGQKNKRIRPSKHTRLHMRAVGSKADEEDED